MKKPYFVFALVILVMGGAILFQDISVYGKVAALTLITIGSFWIGRVTK